MDKKNKSLEEIVASSISRSFRKDIQLSLQDQWIDLLHSYTFGTLFSRFQSYIGKSKREYKFSVPEDEFRKASSVNVDVDYSNKTYIPKIEIETVVEPAIKNAMRSLADYRNLDKKASDYLTQVANKGGQTILNGIPGLSGNIKFRLSKKEYRQAIQDRVTTLIKDLNDTSRTYMKDAFVKALSTDAPKEKMISILEDQGKGFSKMRAERIVRTETLAAFEYMKHETAKLNGITTKIWTTMGRNICPFCIGLAGKKRDIDKEFFKDLLYPPAHPRCECSVQYLDKDTLKESMCDVYVGKSFSKAVFYEGVDAQVFCINPEATWAGGESLVGSDKEVGAIFDSLKTVLNNDDSLSKQTLKRADSIASDILQFDTVASSIGEDMQRKEASFVISEYGKNAFLDHPDIRDRSDLSGMTDNEKKIVYLMAVSQIRLSPVGYVQLKGGLGILPKRK